MARTRAPDFEEHRRAILGRAAELFAARGYAGTSMNDVAAAAGVGKATLYHYVRDKQALLAQISHDHVRTLLALVQAVQAERLAPEAHLRALLDRFMTVYADAQHAHRVLTEDVKFLDADERERVQCGEREVVAAFADAVTRLRPDLRKHATPMAMLLLGMINWTFTWLKPGGALTHGSLAPVVADLFLGGLPQVSLTDVHRPRQSLSAVRRAAAQARTRETKLVPID